MINSKQKSILNDLYRKISSSWTIYVFLFVFILLVTNLRQNHITNFDCEICADKSGYFMYLPAVFYLGFDARDYPVGIDEEHGMGFYLDQERNKVVTKFTCGVAYLLSPFYALGALIALLFSFPVDPFSRYFLIFINIGSSFYIVSGLYFFRKWLDFYVNSTSSFLTMLLVFFGTHLYYYTVDENLMGHLYSFSLLSISMYMVKIFIESGNYRHFILLCLALSLAILIRPTNILFLFIILFLDVNSTSYLKNKFLLMFDPKLIITGLILFTLIMLPQFIYWKYAFGRFIFWSYQGEGFHFWDDPRLLITWFSTQSGLFTYTPIIFLGLIFAGWMIKKRIPGGVLVIIVFLMVSYMCASWSNPFFGECNFGKRPFVEYLPVLMLPFAYGFHHFKTFARPMQITVKTLIIVFIVHNLGLFVVFNTCFDGGTWEWSRYFELIGKVLLLDKI